MRLPVQIETVPEKPPVAARPGWCLLASLLLSGGAFFLAGNTRRFLAWMLPLTGGWLLLLGLWDSLDPLPFWPLSILSLVWLLAWLAMLVASTRARPTSHPLRLLILMLVGSTLTYFSFQQVRSWVIIFKVNTDSMEPTLQAHLVDAQGDWLRPDDFVLMERLSHRIRPPQRGEIIVFASQDIPGEKKVTDELVMAKRVVGLPGERIRLEPPYVFINGQRLTEPEIFLQLSSGAEGYAAPSFSRLPHPVFDPPVLASPEDEILLGPNEYFVLHDNSRAEFHDRPKMDSRHFGPLPGDIFMGRLQAILHPPERRRWLD